MKFIIALAAAFLICGCTGSAPVVEPDPATNTKDQSERVADTVASHTVEGERSKKDDPAVSVPAVPKDGAKRKWSRSGDSIDTSKFDEAVSKGTNDLKSKPDDEALKKVLGNAYFERAVALTSARQYASAIGDFRKAQKYDPSNDGAKQQIAMITSIYNSMNIEVPKEGEEPMPLEFKKQKN